jgi:DNA mismatch endonuclease (patch repair protein)
MAKQRSRNTDTEIALRRALHRKGLRYRVHRRPIPELRREADLLFSKARVAVFVDGCFWHGCATHGTWPRSNADWWREKIERNRARDRETDQLLAGAGWEVVRVWEHEDPKRAADIIEQIVSDRITGASAAPPDRRHDRIADASSRKLS